MRYTLPQPLNIDDGVAAAYFTNPSWKLVVGGLICYRGEVCLIEPAKAPQEASTFTFFQEKVDRFKDRSFRETLARGLVEELGVRRGGFRHHEAALLQFENHIPPARNGGKKLTKHIMYFGLEVPHKGFKLRTEEIRSVRWVASHDEFLEALEPLAVERGDKYVALCTAVVVATKKGLLDWKIKGTSAVEAMMLH
jgi:hypothetical protein